MMIELVGQERVVYEWLDEPGQLRTMVFRVFHHDEDGAAEEEGLEGEPETDSDGYLLVVSPEKFPERDSEEEEEERDALRRRQAESGFPYITIDPAESDFPF
jgi:hypothetical protein